MGIVFVRPVPQSRFPGFANRLDMENRMSQTKFTRLLQAIAFSSLVFFGGQTLDAQEKEKEVREPLYRIGNSKPTNGFANSTTEANAETAKPEPKAEPKTDPQPTAKPNTNEAIENLAPIDRALHVAEEGLRFIRSDVRDFTATMIKRERINGVVGKPEFAEVKIRNGRASENIPFSIYMNFTRPNSIAGREVIFVKGHNDGKLIAHEGKGLIGNITAHLDPDGMLAMKGQRYPIYEAGIENLVYRLIEKGQRDKTLGDAEVKFFEDVKINKRACTLIQVTHPKKRPEYDFYICRVFIDKELNVPIRYAAYGWPEKKGGKPTLEEEYTYLNMKLNVGLTDADFNHENPKYNYK